MAGDVLYLSAPVNALVEGIYHADTSVATIRQHGDMGLGTFNHLDGEMVMVDGEVWQVSGDGRVLPVDDAVCSPFVVATHFRELSQDTLSEGFTDIDSLYARLGELLMSENMMYALRIEAAFTHVRTRSVPRQDSYRPLVEVTKDQPTFDRYDVRGLLAGFYTPRFMSSLNVPGFHLHFLSDDRTFGGHLLQCSAPRALVRVQVLRQLHMDLPSTLAFLTADFNRDIAGDLKRAESESTTD